MYKVKMVHRKPLDSGEFGVRKNVSAQKMSFHIFYAVTIIWVTIET